MNCPESDDKNAKLEGKDHGKNRDLGQGYFSNIHQILGNPNGSRHISDDVVRVQQVISLDYSPGVETIGQNVKLHSKLKCTCHVTQMPT